MDRTIGILGGGSWATAIVKLLQENQLSINWYIREPEIRKHMQVHGNNPVYLSDVTLDQTLIQLTGNVEECVQSSEYLILAIPSAFLDKTIGNIGSSFSGKKVFSAIKGMVPEYNQIVGNYLQDQIGVPADDFGVLTGPCHAEEVALERLTYLTIACQDKKKAEFMADCLRCNYLRPVVSDDIYGTEYSAVMKNIIAIAAGVAHGLGYGDNFQAVLISNGAREIQQFTDAFYPNNRNINASAYLGDLLVTTYSQFSRNRRLGTMLGKGYTVESANLEMTMVAEGYYAARSITEICKQKKLVLPIVDTVYRILYEGAPAREEMKVLTEKLG